MLTDEELYEGFPKEKAATYRKEAIEKYGDEAVLNSETSIKKMGKEEWKKVQEQVGAIIQQLLALMDQDPTGEAVQAQIANHYQFIVRIWGRSPEDPSLPEAYHGLAQLYLDDERFTAQNGTPHPAFAQFISKAMMYFANTLK